MESPFQSSTERKNYKVTKTKKRMKRQRCNKILLLSIILIAIFLLIIYVRRILPKFNSYRLVQSYQSETEVASAQTILLWNPLHSDRRWGLPKDTLTPAEFRDALHCPVYQCELSNNHDYLASVDMYDAIVFHMALPFPRLWLPSKRSKKQTYVFALNEPPYRTQRKLIDERNFYNLTMTYRLDSDIVWPYYAFEDIETGVLISPAKYPKWRQPPKSWNDGLFELWSLKSKDVAWFVSNCRTTSKREKLVKALKRYINIDIFGKCGPKRCSACDKILESSYKFYLSFENSLCLDYVTEKLYIAFNNSAIPIVFGGANYRRFAPPHSYINVENFESVKALASYLKYLVSDPSEYMRYFWWRRYYRAVRRPIPFCDLCEQLHKPNKQDKTESYDDIENWWKHGKCRYQTNIKF